MALQGDLQTFALPDVLRLLAGTAKSGRLEVHGRTTAGELALRSGGIVEGSLHGDSRATEPGEVLFELLRLDEGSFAFDEGDQPDGGATTDVEFALERAEALVRDWAEVEEVVPSMGAWVSLAGADRSDDLALTAGQWQAIVAIGGGGNVRDLAAALELSDLDACRAVASLAEAHLVDVRVSHTTISSTGAEADVGDAVHDRELDGFELDSFDQFEVDPSEVQMTGLEDLVVEDRPVVLEESDDALLPEPLPGEGVAYEGESITGLVDGRTFDAAAVGARADDAGHGSPIDELEDHPIADALDDHAVLDAGEVEGPGGADPFSSAEAADAVGGGSGSATSADTEPEVDDERGSLLRFLSTVRP